MNTFSAVIHPDVAHIQAAGDLVLHERVLVESSGLGIVDVLVEGHADALGQAALGLHAHQIGI